MRSALPVVALGAVLACSPAFACSPIEELGTSVLAQNACPANACDAYAELAPGRGRPQCSAGRCEFAPAQLGYPFRATITLPTSSPYAPGVTFVLAGEDFQRSSAPSACAPPTCVRLPDLGEARGSYTFDDASAQAVGLPVPGGLSVPVRVVFTPLAGTTDQIDARDTGLPLDDAFAASNFQSRNPGADPEVFYTRPLAPGRYLRYSYPAPPYDAYLPPAVDAVRVVVLLVDDLVLGSPQVPLDDPGGTARNADVTRDEGLDGWRMWLADSATGQRISTLRTLTGTRALVRLETTRQSAPGTNALREGVEVVLVPPATEVAVPSLVSPILLGAGLAFSYPALPPPTQVTGLVAVPERRSSQLVAVPGRVSFKSTALTQANGDDSQLLRYDATVTTDRSGKFSIVLPPGLYDVTVEPEESTGRGKVTRPVAIPVASSPYALGLEPPAQTLVTGRAVLSDGRPLAGAEVLASAPAARAGVPSASPSSIPRPGRTRTAVDGTFSLSLDEGTQQIAILPQPGTGFPRVVRQTSVGGETAPLGTIVVPPPVKVAFELRDPSTFVSIGSATIRVFASSADGAPVEVGRTRCSEDGECEILLAPELR